MATWTTCVFIWLFACIFAMAQAAPEVNFSNHKLSGIIKWKYEKRPFCNAFTGCGKKRTPYPPYALAKRPDIEEKAFLLSNDGMADGLSDLIDINAEPAVENVQKQIMSQAKIYEAIKEASKEIFRQKNKQKQQQQQQRLQQQQQQQQQFLQDQTLGQDREDVQTDKMDVGEIA